MKKGIYKLLLPCYKYLAIVLAGVFFITNAKAQSINEGFEEPIWQADLAASSTSGQVVITATSAVSTMTYITAAGVGNSATVINTDPNSGTWWYSKAASNTVTSTYTKLDKVHSPSNSVKLSSSGYIITPLTSSAIVSVTFWANLGTPMNIGIATDPNAAQPSYSSTYPTPLNFSNFSSSFPANAVMTSYSVSFTGITGPVRIGFFNYGGSSTYIDDINVFQPTGTPPSVVTNNNIVPGITNAKVTGTVTPGTLPLLASGIIWSTTPLTGSASDTSLLTKTWDHPSSTSVFTDTANHLSPSTTYYTEAYVIGLDNSVYFGGIKNFTTNPLSTPTVGISLGTIYSNKAAVTGTIIDSGGLIISEKGFIWNTNGNAPTLTNNVGKQYEGSGTQPFSDFIKGLAPNTNYCVSAYAINSKGSSVSPDTCFTTGPPAPTLTAIPGAIDFGQNFYGGSPLILSYTLTGSDLSGAPITITAPAGFIIAMTPSGLGTVTGNTITLTTTNTSTYTTTALSPTPIYVEMPTTAYGTFAGNIIHSGGGVTIAANADMVALTGSIVQSPVDVSNTGTDFWLGFAMEHNMKQKLGAPYPPFSGNGSNMYVYISGAPGTVVTVQMPLLSTPFNTTVTIPASGFTSVTGFPQGDPTDATNAAGLPDARLYYTGVTNRGIHVFSNGGPISVWLYDYATDNTAGGSLIFPTNTWNSNYTVQAYGNTTNTGPPNSFFFVIADQDNTPVYFTPTVDIEDSTVCSAFTATGTDIAGNITYPAGVTDTIYLNTGQVFNAIGAINAAGFGLDLSGTTIRTDCDKKIAVFGGNSRCLISTPVQCTNPGSGSDNMVQQMIPSVAWDTKYFTIPTKTMEHNLYRIYVHNDTANVSINDTTHSVNSILLTTAGTHNGITFNGDYTFTGFPTGGGYYSLETSYPMDVESFQPISITQFITSGDCVSNATVTGNNGGGDPEMIILTGAQQAINNATVYSPIFQDGNAGGAYINIVIPKAGINTFNIDNAALVDTGSSSFTGTAYAAAPLIPVANAFKPYPNNPNYYWAKFHVSYPAVHTMSSTIPFNGIAYGVAGGESYGFNAGTAVKNLTSIQFTDNPYGIDSSATAVRTCVNNPVKLRIALPYTPALVSKITWNPQQDPRISSSALPAPGNDSIAGPMNGSEAQYDSTILVNGQTFYVYTSPVAYTFQQNGTYRFPVQVYGTFASDCPGEDIENMLIIVGHDQANLTYVPTCGSSSVPFSSDTIAMAGTYITKTIFNFGDGTIQINGNLDSSHTYPANQTYTATLTTYNSVGCISSDSVVVDFAGGLKASFTVSTHAVCANGSITFTDNSTSTGVSGTANKWIWAFGDGSNKDSTSVTTAGGNVPHQYNTAGKYYDTLTVRTTSGCIDMFIDSVTIEATPVAKFTGAEACLGNATTFTDQSFVPNNLGTVDSSFWDFGDGTTLDSLMGQTILHQYASAGTYPVKLYVKSDGGCTSTVYDSSIIVDTLPVAGFKIDVNCVTDIVTITDTSNAKGGTIIEWDWSFGDGTTLTATNDSLIHHLYSNGNGQSFIITLTVKTKTGCLSTYTAPKFGIGASPVAQFTVNPGIFCAPNSTVTFTNTSSIGDGTVDSLGYSWDFGDQTDSTVKIPAGATPLSMTHTYASAGPYNVTLIAVSNKGCTNTYGPTTVTINPQPVASINPNPTSTCINDSLLLSGSGGTQPIWNFGDGSAITADNSLQNPNYKWNAPGKYGVSLVVTSPTGCQSAPAIDSVTVNALPVANFTVNNNLPTCANNVITFTDASTTPAGSTITQWHWDFGDGSAITATNSLQNPTHTFTAGTYEVKLWVSDGCISNTDSVAVIVNPLPNVNFQVAPICLPNTAQFTDISTVSDGSGISGPWTWNFGDGSSAPGGPTNSHQYLNGGTYPVTLTVVSGNQCQGDTTINITAYNTPIAKDSIVNDTSLCSNQPVTLIDQSSVSGSSISSINIVWDNSQNIDTTINTPIANGFYSHNYPALPTDNTYTVILTAFSGNGCPPNAPDTTVITVHGSPAAQFTALAPVCQEVAPFVLTNGSDANNLPGSGFYSGNGIENDSVTFSPQLAGPGLDSPIVFTYVSANGCSDTAQQSITIYPTPEINYGGTQYILENDSATLNPISVNGIGLQYMWTPYLYLNSDTSSTPLCKPYDSITYTITVTSPGGCHASNVLFVQVLKDFIVPNTFTPNGDGINDTWIIQELPKYPIQQVDVYDRYGQSVFHSHGYNKPWDGSYKGKMLGAGTYYYIIQLDGLISPKVGYVTILK